MTTTLKDPHKRVTAIARLSARLELLNALAPLPDHIELNAAELTLIGDYPSTEALRQALYTKRLKLELKPKPKGNKRQPLRATLGAVRRAGLI
jgi:hypothetical protein